MIADVYKLTVYAQNLRVFTIQALVPKYSGCHAVKLRPSLTILDMIYSLLGLLNIHILRRDIAVSGKIYRLQRKQKQSSKTRGQHKNWFRTDSIWTDKRRLEKRDDIHLRWPCVSQCFVLKPLKIKFCGIKTMIEA